MDSYALFSFVDTAGIIKDLNIENVSYSNAGYTCKYEAILTGRNNGTIQDVISKGTILLQENRLSSWRYCRNQ